MSFLAAHVVLNGDVTIGEYAYLGSNCNISNGVHVGAQSFIGANALITQDTRERAVHIVEATPAAGIDSLRFIRLLKHHRLNIYAWNSAGRTGTDLHADRHAMASLALSKSLRPATLGPGATAFILRRATKRTVRRAPGRTSRWENGGLTVIGAGAKAIARYWPSRRIR